jgi:hypothetical protein
MTTDTAIATAALPRTSPGALARRLEGCRDAATLGHYADASTYEAVDLAPYHRGWGLLVRGSTGREFLVVGPDEGRATPAREARTWAVALATTAARRRAGLRAESGRVEGLGAVAGLLAAAGRGHGGPRPRIVLPDGGREYHFSPAGARSSHPGTVAVTDAGRYPDRRYFGRIEGGVFLPSRSCDEEALATLARLAADPVGVLAARGRSAGRCCFCPRGLTTVESTTAGYGPDCAARFGLPWGLPGPSNVAASHEPRDDDPGA